LAIGAANPRQWNACCAPLPDNLNYLGLQDLFIPSGVRSQ
jgi:hypothetical protein